MHDAPESPADPRGDAETAFERGLVGGLVGIRRAIASYQALEVQMMAAAQSLAEEQMSRIPSAASREREMPLRSIAAEIGAATRSNDRSVQQRMSEAGAMAARLPAALKALAEGRIDRAHLMVMHEVGMPLPEGEALAEFERLAVAIAERETPGRMRSLIRILASRLHPESLTDRHARARQRRSVSVTELDDGMAEVRAVLPSALAFGIEDRLTQLARSVIESRRDRPARDEDATEADARDADRESSGPSTAARSSGPDDTRAPDGGGEPDDAAAHDVETLVADAAAVDSRTMAELRADIFADLLLTGAPETRPAPPNGKGALDSIRAQVHVVIPVETLVGTGDSPGELFGNGPVDSETLRRLASNAPAWTRVFTHPVTGEVVAVDRYRPSEAQSRLLTVRDEHCRFPGCRQPAWRCDIDHTVDAARGGPTHVGNLAHLCRRHHSLKHHSAWTVTQLAGGKLEWTSPQGRVYLDLPARTVAFAATGDPPPF